MDFMGVIIGVFSFFVVMTISLYLLKKCDLNRVRILQLVVLSALGHFWGGVVFYRYAISNGGDSLLYFTYANTQFNGLSSHFIFFLFGFLKILFLGSSLLGAFLFSAALGFLGSIFYLLTFKHLLDRISLGQRYFLINNNIIAFPALILLCWPSYFFWSAGLGKDSLAFLSIGLFLFALSQQKLRFRHCIILIFSVTLAFLVRPYLFLIGSFSLLIYILFMSKLKLTTKILFICILFLLANKLLSIIAHQTSLTSYSLEEISRRAVENQVMTTSEGASSISVPTHNYYLMYLFLPYLMIVNLFLPLFYGIKNVIALISSIENLYFLGLTWGFIKQLHIWKSLRAQLPFVNFLMIYFLTGMAFLGMINTNLGLAMREKMMYVPAFLIVIMLVYAYKRILIIQHFLANQDSQNLSKID